MARKAFKCNKCDRSFSMAAHLARHQSTIHASKQNASRKASAKTARVGRPRGRRTTASRSPIRVATSSRMGDEGAVRLISEMEAYHRNLTDRRMSLENEIEAIAAAMQMMGGTSPGVAARRGPKPKRRAVGRPRGSVGRPRGSAGRAGSLKDYIVRVLSQRITPMKPNEIGASVKKAGFKTKAKDLTKAVSNALPQLKNVKRVGFGVYQLAGR